ncbi:MAG: putative lipid II flippase FtsW [Actinomycetota bacterium]|jgi:cell division protein FtsW|nr:putative lipid II flippase FtsW [Actinomycetota bacterium]
MSAERYPADESGVAGAGAVRGAAAAGIPARLRLVAGGPVSEHRTSQAAPGRVERPKRSAPMLLGLVVAVCAVGLVMVLSASAYTSLVDYGSVWSIFERQVLWMVLGTVALLVTSRIPYERWRRFRSVLLVGTMALLLAVLVPGLGTSAGGSSRWLGFGQLRVQPSELMNLALAIFAADLVARRSDRVDRTGAVMVPMMLVLGASALLVAAQPDLGTAVVLTCVAFACLFAGGVPARTVLTWFAATAGLATVGALARPYQRARLLSFIDPLAHRLGSGYQVVQSLVALGSGGVAGTGLGNGQAKWGLLPNPHTDFIFSVIGQETGLVGALVVVGLFAALAAVGLRVAARAPDRFGMLLATAITCWITAEAVINIGAVIGMLPVTGIPLPYVSYGGSSLVVIMAGTGILLNIARRERRAAPGRQRAAPAVRGGRGAR